MELLLVTVKAFGAMMGIALAMSLIFTGLSVVWIRRKITGRIYCVFYDENKSISSEFIKLTAEGEDSPTGLLRSEDGGQYLIDATRMYWYMWPPGLPQVLREPVPALTFSRGNPSPWDPSKTRTQVTSKSLRYMMDEGMLRQTWKEAQESIGDKTVAGLNMGVWIGAGTALGVGVLGYLIWTTMATVNDIAAALGVG